MNKKKIVLLVDDDPDYLFQKQMLLQNWGFEVMTAESQREAENIIEKTQPDLALLDLMMENEDSGFILSYKIKRKYPNLPVIIATSVTAETGMEFNSDGGDQRWIKADLFLDKGVAPEILQREIKKLLEKH